MTLKRPSLSFLIPLLLASPMLTLGQYGTSLGEILVLYAGVLCLLTTGWRIRLPGFLLLYLLLFTIGRITSLVNAPRWGIPVGIERISFVYVLGLPVLAYLVGRHSHEDPEQIMTGRTMAVFIGIVAVFAAAYPFLGTAARKVALYWFVVDFETARYTYAPRFPGIGINGNIYCFMVFIVLMFSFRSYLKGRSSLFIPICAVVIIAAAAGVLMMFCAGAGCLVLWLGWYVEARRGHARSVRRRLLRVSRRLVKYIAAGAICLAAATFFFQDKLEELAPNLVFLARIDQYFVPHDGPRPSGEEDLSPMEGRLYHWRLGMERVKMAPLLGIATNIYEASDTEPLLFSAPHSEFIFYWTAFGFFGLLAMLWLVLYLIAANVRRKTGLVWVVIYLALVLQMTFDGAIQYVRFVGMLFMLIGLNVTQWQLKASAMAGTRARCRALPVAAQGTA